MQNNGRLSREKNIRSSLEVLPVFKKIDTGHNTLFVFFASV